MRMIKTRSKCQKKCFFSARSKKYDFDITWNSLTLYAKVIPQKIFTSLQQSKHSVQTTMDVSSEKGGGAELCKYLVLPFFSRQLTFLTTLTLKSSPLRLPIPRKVPGMISRIKLRLKLMYSNESRACKSTSLMV